VNVHENMSTSPTHPLIRKMIVPWLAQNNLFLKSPWETIHQRLWGQSLDIQILFVRLPTICSHQRTAGLLYFGTAGFLYFGTAGLLYFGTAGLLYFDTAGILYFGTAGILYFGTAGILYFGTAGLLHFGRAGILYFGTAGLLYLVQWVFFILVHISLLLCIVWSSILSTQYKQLECLKFYNLNYWPFIPSQSFYF